MTKNTNKTILAIASVLITLLVVFLIDVNKPNEEASDDKDVTKSDADIDSLDSSVPSSSSSGRTKIRWFIGLSTGTDPQQKEIEQRVVDFFNASQDRIDLEIEFVPYNAARDNLTAQIDRGNAPDIIGPMGIGVSNFFHDQWLDLQPLIEETAYDLTVFTPSSIEILRKEGHLYGLPVSVFPAVLYYQKPMFDQAGMNYPPARIGDPYVLPDGDEVDWNWETLALVAKNLTLDSSGLNAFEAGFNAKDINQTGYHPIWSGPVYVGTFFEPATPWTDTGKNYTAQIPEPWVAAWRWWYDGIHGKEPYIASGELVADPIFGSGNPFNAQKTAMVLTQLWYTCCVADAGNEWDLASFPSYQGSFNGRLDVDTFRIWKGTQNPKEAFEVLSYLISPQSASLLCLGDEDTPGGAYNAFPALFDLQDEYIERLSAQYPHVQNWSIVQESLNYPDIPNAESWMPNWSDAWTRIDSFGLMLQNDASMNFDSEIEQLQKDLEIIFNE